MPEITQLLAGKEIEAILKNKDVLVIRCTNGDELHIGWRDTKGDPIAGEPEIRWYGRRVYAQRAIIGAVGQRLNGS